MTLRNLLGHVAAAAIAGASTSILLDFYRSRDQPEPDSQSDQPNP